MTNNLALITDAIDATIAEEQVRRQHPTLRCSTLGHPCERLLWYQFRWAMLPAAHSGRILRLFETGQLEEARMIAWLGKVGIRVWSIDPVSGRQKEVVGLDGHLHGSIDGIAGNIPGDPETPYVLECKTHNKANFEQLVKYGIDVSHPAHMAQMQIYMHLSGIGHALYLAKCKDNDALYAERVLYDKAHADALLAKAERVRDAEEIAPPRISDNPNYFLCKAFQCPAYAQCHEETFALRNCRTCLHVSPVQDGQWYCQRHEQERNTEEQKAGCPDHLFLPALVPGEQIDVDGTSVLYLLKNGKEWRDQGGDSL